MSVRLYPYEYVEKGRRIIVWRRLGCPAFTPKIPKEYAASKPAVRKRRARGLDAKYTRAMAEGGEIVPGGAML